MHTNSIGCPKIFSLSAPVLYWLLHLTCISSTKTKNERKTFIFTQIKISRYNPHFFAIFSRFLEIDLRPLYRSLTSLSGTISCLVFLFYLNNSTFIVALFLENRSLAITVNATKTLLSAFVLSKLGYCNSLHCDSTQFILDKLQKE